VHRLRPLVHAGQGSKKPIMAPSRGPPKSAISRGKAAGVTMRALWGQQWTRLSSRRAQVLPRRGMAFAHHHGAASGEEHAGQRDPRSSFWPPSRSLGSCPFAGKNAWESAIRAFGVRNGLVCLFRSPQEVLPRRGHGLRPPSGVGLAGVEDGDHGPLPRPSETPFLQGRKLRGPRFAPLGSGMDSSAFTAGTSTATTGHGLRPLVHARQGSKNPIIAPFMRP
jgi:hypothetical protein